MSNEINKKELLDWLKKIKQTPGFWQWDNEYEQAYNQIVALIKKPKVTEEWIEEKVKKLLGFHEEMRWLEVNGKYEKAKDFIRKLYDEMPAKKAEIDMEFIKEQAEYFSEHVCNKTLEDWQIENEFIIVFKEAGIEVKK